MEKIFDAEQYSKKVKEFEGKRPKDYNPFFDKVNVVVSRLYYNRSTKKAEYVNLFINKKGKCLAIDTFYLKDGKIYFRTDIPANDFDEDLYLIPSIAIKGIGANDEARTWLNLEKNVDEGTASIYLKGIFKTIESDKFAEALNTYITQKNIFHQKWREYQDKISVEMEKIDKYEKRIEILNKKILKLQKAQKNEAVEPHFERKEIEIDFDYDNKDEITYRMERE